MQRFEDFQLLGTRRPAPSAADVEAATADRMLRYHESMKQSYLRTQTRSTTPARRTKPARRLGVRETRPGGASVGRSGNGDLQGALQRLRGGDPTLIAAIQRRPDLASNALARLDQLLAALDKGARC